MDWLRKLFDNNERDVAKYREKVEGINELEPKYVAMSNAQLREITDQLREKVQTGWAQNLENAERDGILESERKDKTKKALDDILDEILPDAFAIVREAAKRTIRQRHYDVQLIGGMVAHDCRIAELKTGEGKTLMATLPLYLNALAGRGAHLVTANDYLSKVGAVWMGPIYHFLGMSVGIIQGQSPETGDEGGSYVYDPEYEDPDPRFTYCRPVTRREAYLCDITYGTNNEFGFDYLRDNMAFSAEELVMRELHFAIVDEVDSILIDEARTPLIISGFVEQDTHIYGQVARVVSQLKGGKDIKTQEERDDPNADIHNPNIDYVVDEKQKTIALTDAGVQRFERMLGLKNLADDPEMMHHVTAAIKAQALFKKDIDYVVKDGEIIIVDEFTGRLMFGRRYSDGLHQAIEAKEGVEVKHESQTLATITFQNLFRLYLKLAGMTGTAKTEEDEFRKIYGLDVVVVPTNMPMIRKDQPDIIYKVAEHKFRGIAWEILRLYARQQPVLVGTRSIEMSEKVSERITSTSLQALCMISIIRHTMDNTKNLDKGKVEKWLETLNGDLDRISLNRLNPILKELGLQTDPFAENSLQTIAELLEVSKDEDILNNIDEALRHGIPHNILNAKYHEKEAIIIAEAGRKGAITIATNMAGRGVDILLGGKPQDMELPEEPDKAQSDDEEGSEEESVLSYRRGGKHSVLDSVTTLTPEEYAAAADEVRRVGGLYILGTERHESRRIDNQLRGRSGRQGDPGESRFYVSLEDELWRLFGDRSNHPLLRTWPEDQAMDARILSKMIERAQKKVEENHFESRNHVLHYDDVMNKQREIIYGERKRILQGADLKETITGFLNQVVADAVSMFCPDTSSPNEWELDDLYQGLDEYFPLSQMAKTEDLYGKTSTEIRDFLTDLILEAYERKEREIDSAVDEQGAMRELERNIALQTINRKWMEHLAGMDYLREGIFLRSYAQQDPLMVYQKEGFEMFETMQHSIQDEIARYLFRVQVVQQPQRRRYPQYENLGSGDNKTPGAGGTGTSVRQSGKKLGRNDPCWCGSGKKYKACHYPN